MVYEEQINFRDRNGAKHTGRTKYYKRLCSGSVINMVYEGVGSGMVEVPFSPPPLLRGKKLNDQLIMARMGRIGSP